MATLFELANFFIFEKLAIFFLFDCHFWCSHSKCCCILKIIFRYSQFGIFWSKTRCRHFLSTKWKKVLQKSHIFVDFWIFCWRSFKVIGHIYTSPRPCGHFGTNMMSIGYIMAEICVKIWPKNKLFQNMWPYSDLWPISNKANMMAEFRNVLVCFLASFWALDHFNRPTNKRVMSGNVTLPTHFGWQKNNKWFLKMAEHCYTIIVIVIIIITFSKELEKRFKLKKVHHWVGQNIWD